MTLQPYYFGQTQVQPAVSVASPTNQALGVPAGQYGGQGMGMPAGATAAPTGGMNISGAASYGVDALSQALSQYVAADQARAAARARAAANVRPALVNFQIPQLAPREPIQG